MIKVAILDFGGVIRQEGGRKLSKRLAELWQAEAEAVKQVMGPIMEKFSCGKIDEAKFWQELGTALNQPIPEKTSGVWAEANGEFTEYPGTAEWIAQIKQKGVRPVILSNTLPPLADNNRRHGDYALFDGVYLSCEIGWRKPDINAYKRVLEKENIKGEEALFVDDKADNLIPAQELGMKTVWARNPEQFRAEVLRILTT